MLSRAINVKRNERYERKGRYVRPRWKSVINDVLHKVYAQVVLRVFTCVALRINSFLYV